MCNKIDKLGNNKDIFKKFERDIKQKLGIKLYKTSALTGEGVMKMFERTLNLGKISSLKECEKNLEIKENYK